VLGRVKAQGEEKGKPGGEDIWGKGKGNSCQKNSGLITMDSESAHFFGVSEVTFKRRRGWSTHNLGFERLL